MELSPVKTAKVICGVCLKDASAYGGFIFYLIAAGAFAVLGNYQFSYVLIGSLIAVTAIVMFFRLAYNKPRPGRKKIKYKTIYEAVDGSSFPSIHAARAVMISVAFFSRLPALLPVLIIMIILVCASRIYFKRHDMIDITAGIVLGLILGALFFPI